MDIKIRTETHADHPIVFNLIKEAFASLEISDQTEHLLVQRLRKSDAFVPELSLVASVDNQVVGHILLTKIHLQSESTKINSLALAPVSVLPNMQGNGIGGMLIKESHLIATYMNFGSIVLIGHEDYYPRFGYRLASQFGITFPFDVPDKNAFAIELKKNALSDKSGQVIYSAAFFE